MNRDWLGPNLLSFHTGMNCTSGVLTNWGPVYKVASLHSKLLAFPERAMGNLHMWIGVLKPNVPMKTLRIVIANEFSSTSFPLLSINSNCTSGAWGLSVKYSLVAISKIPFIKGFEDIFSGAENPHIFSNSQSQQYCRWQTMRRKVLIHPHNLSLRSMNPSIYQNCMFALLIWRLWTDTTL